MNVNENAAELPLEGVGARLRRARELSGRSRADFARQTRIAERMLAALEDGDYAALPARTYATGFARSYARAVGLDAESVVAEVRRELDGNPSLSERPAAPTFEPGDPARVPSRRIAWIAAAMIVLVLIGLAAWRASTQPVSSLPSILPADAPPAPPPAPTTAPAPTPQPAGPVVFTAEAATWVQITAGGIDLLRHEMKPGEAFTLPDSAADPRLRTARPDAIAITIGGKPVPKIADKQVFVANVPVSAAALLARTAAPPTPAASPPGAAPVPAPPPAAGSAHRPRPRPTTSASGTPLPAPESTAVAEPSTAAQ